MGSTLGMDSIVQRNQDTLATDMEGETILMHIESGTYFGASGEVAGSVWRLLAEEHSVAEICAALGEEFDVDVERCQHDTLEYLKLLEEHNLLQVHSAR